MAEKRIRTLKVYGQTGYKYKDVSTIILKGKWLEEAGFTIGTNITVMVDEGGKILLERNDKAI